MVDLSRDFWIRETGTGQQVAQLHDRYDDDDDIYIYIYTYIHIYIHTHIYMDQEGINSEE